MQCSAFLASGSDPTDDSRKKRSIGGATTKHAYWGLEVAVEKLVWSTFILYKMVQGCGWVSDIGSRMPAGSGTSSSWL